MAVIIISPFDPDASTKPYTSAVLLSICSFLAVLLMIVPFLQNFRNRNVGAASLILLAQLANLQNTVNAMIWANDAIHAWKYFGEGLCDIEIKMVAMMNTAFPASVFCMLRGLAKVMDMKDSGPSAGGSGKHVQWRSVVLDLVICWLLPSLEMITQYCTQVWRFALASVSGCAITADNSWLSIVTVYVPPIALSVVNVYYAGLIMYRLRQHRVHVGAILKLKNTTRNRFFRLYALCLICIVVLLPLNTWTMAYTIALSPVQPYSWAVAHDPATINNIVAVTSGGVVPPSQWIYLGGGWAVFLVFGFGDDAMQIYRQGLLALACGRPLPRLSKSRPEPAGDWMRSTEPFAKTLLKSWSRSWSSWWRDTKQSWASKSVDVEVQQQLALPKLTMSGESFALPMHVSVPAADTSQRRLSRH